MAAYAALVSLLSNIHAIINHPTLSTSIDNKHIQPLLEKTGVLLDFIEGNNYGAGSKEAQDLERKIASAAHAVEDLIESHIVDQIHEAKSIRSYSLKSLDLQQINEDMDAIMKEANEFNERLRLGEEQQPARLAGHLMQSGETSTTMVGLDAELNQLLDELTGYQSSRRIISIVGMGGIGKTTLAKNVFENLLIKESFQFRAWATISQQNNAKEILSKLLSCLGGPNSRTVDELGLELYQSLCGRRYLIVLDDIWSVRAWDEVKHFFPDNGNRSRILLTTRLSNVAKDCGSSLFMMNLLDEENSWKLFSEKAFQNKHCPPELREVSGEIVKLCKGLALSIVVVGGLLLKSSRTVGYWKQVEKDLKSIPNSEEKHESLDVLSLSYHHLPPHLKPCFLYMGVFKQNSHIRVSKIIRLWIGEGFIKPIGSQVLEEIAKGFIKDLTDRNLIHVDTKNNTGKVRSCGIHDLLRAICIKLAKQEDFFHVIKGGVRGTEHHMVVDKCYPDKTGVKHPLIRSIMMKGFGCKPIESTQHRLLRVLDEDCYSFQANHYEKVNLRYLKYNMVDITSELPTSVPLIWNLQTLIIHMRTFVGVVVAPYEFWKMQQLRHVCCDYIYLPCRPPSNEQDGLVMLENLQTLKRALNLKLSEEVCRIISNIKKLYLFYDDVLRGYDDSLVEYLCNLDRLHKLESLKLNYWSWMSKRNKLDKRKASYPRSLKKLFLSSFILQWDDLTMISLLPQLEVLKLEYLSFCEEGQWSFVDGQFPRLKFLSIQRCDLVWDGENSHFPVLKKIFLKYMDNLGEIPIGISDIPTLELLDVDRCSNSAVISAIRIKEENLDNGGELQVQVVVEIRDQESFDKMLETEGLTTDNIQLEILAYIYEVQQNEIYGNESESSQ